MPIDDLTTSRCKPRIRWTARIAGLGERLFGPGLLPSTLYWSLWVLVLGERGTP